MVPLLLSLGKALPWLDGFVRLLPGIGMLTNPSRYLIFSVVILCVGAGGGVERFLSADKSRLWKVAPIIMAGVVLFLGMLIPPVWGADPGTNIRFAINAAIFICLISLYNLWKQKRTFWRWALLGWLIVDPLLIAPAVLNGYRVQDIEPPGGIIKHLKNYPEPPRVAIIQPGHLRGNLISPLEDWVFTKNRIGRAGGYEPLALLGTLNFLGKMDATDQTISATFWGFRLFGFNRPKLYNLAGISHLLATTPLSHPQLQLVINATLDAPDFHGGRWRDQRLYLYENKTVFSRAVFMPDNFTGHVRPVTVEMDSVNRRKMELECNVPGTVFLSESFHPGWIGMDKGAPLVIKPFADTFISFKVAAGHHLVTLEFLPKSYRLGRWFSGAGLILVALFCGYARYQKQAGGKRRENE